MSRADRSILYFCLVTLIAIALWLLWPLVEVAMVADAAGATPATTVTVPWGAWLAAAAPDLTAALVAVALWLLRQLPSEISAHLRTQRVEQVLSRAIGYGLNSVAGAAHDRVLTVDVGSAVLSAALGYVVAHAPAWLVEWMGGEDDVAEKIWARLRIADDVGMSADEALDRAAALDDVLWAGKAPAAAANAGHHSV